MEWPGWLKCVIYSCYLGQSMCQFNRLPRVAHRLADYPECLQFCWDFVKPLKQLFNIFFLACSSARIFSISFVLHAIRSFFSSNERCRNFIFQNHPSPLSKVKWSAPKIYYHLYRNYKSTRNTSVSKLRQNLPGTSRAIKNITKRRKSSTERHHYVHKNSCKKPHFGKQNYLT